MDSIDATNFDVLENDLVFSSDSGRSVLGDQSVSRSKRLRSTDPHLMESSPKKSKRRSQVKSITFPFFSVWVCDERSPAI